MTNFLKMLDHFATAHSLPRDLASRIRKANEELGELAESIIVGEHLNEIEAEACDHVNTALLILMAVSKDPMRALADNLMAKDAKYAAGERRVEAKR